MTDLGGFDHLHRVFVGIARGSNFDNARALVPASGIVLPACQSGYGCSERGRVGGRRRRRGLPLWLRSCVRPFGRSIGVGGRRKREFVLGAWAAEDPACISPRPDQTEAAVGCEGEPRVP